MIDDSRRRLLDELRARWYAEARPFDADLPAPFPPALALQPKHVRSAVLVNDRNEALKLLSQGGTVAEVGTLRGDYAQKILEVCHPRQLHIIDKDFSHFALEPSLFVTLHEGDSADILTQFPDGYFDWIYLDGEHRYVASNGMPRSPERRSRATAS